MSLLHLSAPVEFEPVSQLSSVFFDCERGQVLSVRGGGVTGVVVRSLEENLLTARLTANTAEPIISIKLSPSLATLSLQRSRQTVTFLPLTTGGPDEQAEYSQAARAKHCALLGFLWLSNSDLLYVTDCGLETFTVCQERRTVKYSRSAGESLAWYVVSGHLVVTSSQAETDSLTVWSVRGGNILKVSSIALGHTVTDKEVKLLSVYLTPYICVTVDQQIKLFNITTDTVSLSHVLTDVDSGTIGLHSLDNIIMVHSLSLSRTKLYDLKVCDESEPLSVSPVVTSSITSEGRPVPYSPNWVIFLPNVLVDARTGRMLSVNMKLSTNNLPTTAGLDNLKMAKFLINRQQGKTPLINLLKSCVAGQVCLGEVSQILRSVVTAFTLHHLHLSHSSDPGCSTSRRSLAAPPRDFPPAVVLDQPDIFTNVLNTFTDSGRKIVTIIIISDS